MIKREKYALLFRPILAAACLLAIISALFSGAGRVNADGGDIQITFPQSGDSLPAWFEVSGDYAVYDVQASDRYKVVIELTSLDGGGFLGFYTTESYVSGSEGSFAIEVNMTSKFENMQSAGQTPGRYELKAILYVTRGVNDQGLWKYYNYDLAQDTININFGGGSSSGSSSGGGGAIAAVVIGGAAVAGGGLLVRSRMKKGKTPQKTAGGKKPEPKTIEEAARNLAEGRRNRARLDRLNKLRGIVANDSRLIEFVNGAGEKIIGADGEINLRELNRLEGTLKHWINRDTQGPKLQDYTVSDAYYDTVRQSTQGWTGIAVRGGLGFLTGGYSEMALNPISAVSTMRDSINQDKSTLRAVTDGYAHSGISLALGESGRLVKYAKPVIDDVKDTVNMWRIGRINDGLKTELSTIDQLARQGHTTRDAFMRSSEVVRAGETAAAKLDHAERLAMELNNNAEFRKLLAENSKLVPNRVKEVMGVAKQKVYENARNEATEAVMKEMAKDGVNTAENPFFIRQTGTHAQPGNPGWNSLKSDFDHTVEFGSSKYNQFYEQRFNASLEAQGTSATAIDANVYGAGTSARGAYEGGALKFVQHYNETSGSDIMIRNVKGVTNITRETPQTSTSLLSRMNASDVKSAQTNYQNFFKKDLAKGGTLDNQITNGSKTVSRSAGQYSTKYVEHFQATQKVNYQPPDAAKVADLIKKQGYSVDAAMKKVGYGGSKEQLLSDYKKIMGM